MNGTLIFGGIALFFIISALITFVNDLHDDVDTTYGSTPQEYGASHGQNRYSGTNMFGEETLVLTTLGESEKKSVWNKSFLKNEVEGQFPNFSEMKQMVDERLVDSGAFKQTLLKKIEELEEGFISGTVTAESAQTALSSF